MNRVTIVDYGLGNILSVTRAFEYCGSEVQVTDSAKEIDSAERLVLPGVGACPDGMSGLRQRGLVESVQKFALSGRPFLGICLGMQMMLETSEEYGVHEGLNIIPGKVRAIPPTSASGIRHRIPHIGWNSLKRTDDSLWEGTILSEVDVGEYVYFVHSFAAETEHERNRLAEIEYGEGCISAVIRQGNAFGCQFHPEKSGPVGLKIIRSFSQMEAL